MERKQTLEKKALLSEMKKDLECDLCSEAFTSDRWKVYMKNCLEKCQESKKLCIVCITKISQKNIQSGLPNCCPYRCTSTAISFGKDSSFMQYLSRKAVKDFVHVWKDIILPKQISITFPIIQPKIENVIRTQRAIIFHFQEIVEMFKNKCKANWVLTGSQIVLTVLLFTPVYPVALTGKIGLAIVGIGSACYYGWSFSKKNTEIENHFRTLSSLENDAELATFFEIYEGFKRKENPKMEYAVSALNAVAGGIAGCDAIYSIFTSSISQFGNLLVSFGTILQILATCGENQNLKEKISRFEELISELKKTTDQCDKTYDFVKRDASNGAIREQ